MVMLKGMLIVGSLVLLLAAATGVKTWRLANSSHLATATVEHVSRPAKGGTFLQLSFTTADGLPITTTAQWDSRERPPEAGGTTELRYLPGDEEQVAFTALPTSWTATALLAAIGLVFVLVGAALLSATLREPPEPPANGAVPNP